MLDLIQIAHAAEETTSADSGGVIGMLGINWKLFIAQLVNFGIIVFILWRWVFRPVTLALSRRTKKIEESLEQAKINQEEKERLAEYERLQMIKLSEEHEKIVAEAQGQAGRQKQEILNEAQGQAERLIKAAENRIAAEKERMLMEVREELAGLVVDAAEKVIAERLDGKKDLQLIKESLNSARKE